VSSSAYQKDINKYLGVNGADGASLAAVNIDELEADLPNGLHDSRLRTFSSNTAQRRAEFVLDVWVGDLHRSAEVRKEPYRAARLELLGLAYLIVDDPDPRYAPADFERVQIDACGPDDDPDRSRQVPEGGFAGRFFVTEWNAFIHFAALEARLTWIETN
jgi:hypothetical protein